MNLTDILYHRPMLVVVIMMAAGIVLGLFTGGVISVSIAFCLVIAFVMLTVLFRRRGKVATVTLLFAVVAFGQFLLIHSYATPYGTTFSMPGWERVERVMYEQRESFAQVYRDNGLADDEYAVAVAMTLGDRSAVDSRLKEIYSKSGAAHVFAVSGLHMGILWGFLTLLLPVRSFPRVCSIIQILLLWMYAMLVGLHPSVLRAVMMLTVYTLCGLWERDSDSFNALVFTAFVLLLFVPQWLFDVGFQMSFMATLSIIVLFRKLDQYFPRVTRRDTQGRKTILRVMHWVFAIIGVSIAAQIAVAPLIALYFGRISLYFLLTNLVVSPAATIIIVLAFVIQVFSFFLSPLGIASVLTPCLSWIVGQMNAYLRWVVELPSSTVEGISLSVMQTILLYVIMGCVVVACYILMPSRDSS